MRFHYANGHQAEIAPAKFASLNLLIVDDDVTTRNLCNDVALEAGLHVHASATTAQALAILDQYPIDIVVTDLKIPQIGGLELIKRIRTGNPQVSIIVLTQYGTIETAIEATRLGATDYITKPFHVAELRTNSIGWCIRLRWTRRTSCCANSFAANRVWAD